MKKTNYEMAKEEADKVDEQIIQLLESHKSFRVEAGAGSGKTYSLNKAIEWIQYNKEDEYKKNKKHVACITYTNAAVDVITERLKSDSFIEPSTIHSFAWNVIKQYQSSLIKMIREDEKIKQVNHDKITAVKYTLGTRYVEDGIYYLHHNDVLELFVKLLDNKKFRSIFANLYPLILIDECQDSNKNVIDQFIKYFISKDEGPQFGLFGDSWQTIYQSNNACGLIDDPHLSVVGKKSNFRSAPRIVELLNTIRSDLPQISAIDDYEGEVLVITCDDYKGERRTDRNFKGDLPIDVLQQRINKVKDKIKSKTDGESLKVLMITHKVLAKQQGYERLLDILNDDLKDKNDSFLLFFMNIVEPIYKALKESNMQLLFNTLGIRRFPIETKKEKLKWKQFENNLTTARTKNAIDVLECVISSKLIPIPADIEEYTNCYKSDPDKEYAKVTIKEFLNIEYDEFLSAVHFLYPESEFSTEHGVKGEEYDNVIFVISKGWNNYQFEKYMPMLNGNVSKSNQKAFERNRNLFYVCCSRPKKRLIFFVSVEMSDEFRSFMEQLVGRDHIITYSEYINL